MNAHSPAAKTAIVIGAGFGGLALAIRLQSAGIATTLVEARDKPGGRGAGGWARSVGRVPRRGPDLPSAPPRCAGRAAGADRADMARRRRLMPVSPLLSAHDGRAG